MTGAGGHTTHPAAPLDARPGAGRALHPWLVVLALAPGIILTLADATVMTITVQAIIRQVGGSVVSVSWVMNGYNLVLTVLFLPMGRLGDRYGHKLVFTLGLALFTAASLPCALRDERARAGRLARRAGGRRRGRRAHGAGPAPAGVPRAPAGLRRRPVRRRQLARRRRRPRARRRARPVLGLAGGVLVQPPGRRSLGVILALTLTRGLRTPRTRATLDWPGVGLVSAGLFCVTLAIIQGNDWGWVSAAVIGLFAGGAALLLVWVWWELRTPSPLFDLRLFRDRTFAASATAVMTVDTAMMGTMFMRVIFMIAMMDYSELKAGLAIAILPVAVMILTPPAGWLADRIGPRWLAVTGRPGDRRRARRARAPRADRPGERAWSGAARSSAPASASRCRRCSPPGWASSPAATRAPARAC